MKRINLQLVLFGLMGIVLLANACKENPCDEIVCLNGGVCLDGTCNCPEGFSGTNCAKEDFCFTQNKVCENGGTCLNGNCVCPDGYIGVLCENFDPANVQILLDGGQSPKALFDKEIPLDSLYGKVYEGGLIFYLNTTDGTGLVAAPNDQSMGVAWGCLGTGINGADGTAIGTGAQNTMDILNGCSGSGVAAKHCHDLDLNGYDDWFLPSRDELNIMWTNLADSDGDGNNTGPSDPGNLGGFSAESYWSSTEDGDYWAWKLFSFFGSLVCEEGKDGLNHVRAVRAF